MPRPRKSRSIITLRWRARDSSSNPACHAVCGGTRKQTRAAKTTTEAKKLCFVLENEVIVLIHVHQLIEVGTAIQANLNQPSFIIRIFVNDRWMFVQVRIDGQNQAGDG